MAENISKVDYQSEIVTLASYAANWYMNDLNRNYWDAIRNAIDDSVWIKSVPHQHLALQYSNNANSLIYERLLEIDEHTTIHSIIKSSAYYAVMNDVDKQAREILNNIQNKLAALMDHWFDQLYQLDTFQAESWCEERMKRCDDVQAKLDKVTAEYNHIDDMLN